MFLFHLRGLLFLIAQIVFAVLGLVAVAAGLAAAGGERGALPLATVASPGRDGRLVPRFSHSPDTEGRKFVFGIRV